MSAIAERGTGAPPRPDAGESRERAEPGARRSLLPRSLGREVRQALRRLARHPGFTVPAVLSLGVGIGTAAAVFVLLDAVVLRPLPYPQPERLVRMWSAVPRMGPETRWGLGRPQFLYYREHARSFERMGLYVLGSATLAPGGETPRPAEETAVAYVSASLPSVLGVAPALGRGLTADDNLAPDARVALLSDAFWRREFGADPALVGRTISVDGRPVRVVGILRPGARLPEELSAQGASIGIWMPLHLDPSAPPTGGGHVFRAIGRLRAGVTPAEGAAELARLTTRFPEALPGAYSADFFQKYGLTPLLLPLAEDVVGGTGRVLWILWGAALVVLVVAITNVANLFLSRLEARRGEIAMRAALGASRADLARHFVVEMSMVAGAAGLLGLGLAFAATRMLVAIGPASLPRAAEAAVGGREIGFTLLLAATSMVLVGLLPLARHLPDPRLVHDAGRGATASRRRHGTRKALVAGQVSLSLVLVVAAALLYQSFRKLRAVEPGFEPAGVLTFRLVLPQERYASFESVAAFYRELTLRLERIPGVASAGLTSSLPLSGFDGCSSVFVEGSADAPPCVPVHVVTPGFFRAMGIPLRGSAPDWAEVQAGTAGVVVSDALARRLWPQAPAMGRPVGTSARTAPYRVTGVIPGLREHGLDQGPSEALYVPLLPAAGVEALMGAPPRSLRVVVRDRAGRPGALVPAVRRTLAELDPGVAMADTRPMPEIVAASMWSVSFAALLVGLACGVSVALSLMGIYGVVSYLAAQRRKEIGIRMAVGAEPRQVGRMVLGQSLRLAAAGVAGGLALALAATRALRSLLFEVDPLEPATLACGSLLLVAIAAAASYVPVVRAMRTDPAELLRHE